MRRIAQVVAAVLFVAVSLYGHFIIAPAMDPALGACRWLFAGLFVVALAATFVFGRSDQGDLKVFVAQSVAAVALVFLLATSMFPNLVVASADSVGPAITLVSAAAGDTTLVWMTGIACIGVPLVLVYHVLAYRAFRGRLGHHDA